VRVPRRRRPPGWTAARTEAALAEASCRMLAVIDLLEEVPTHLPEPPDIDDHQPRPRCGRLPSPLSLASARFFGKTSPYPVFQLNT